ncbi:S-adenosyl-L-methionine-dependent methyltransferase [Dichotomopilus funicola]|uniref:S-adenosyl-L-methionine-dependent methyltransferase n=1 Tax=Dichotomopilus funicola TaxID=1934379 RepID=A0AAN6ZKL5_9PEZI|nr:S-adenosyl-L-methionine-dependent methyltransferase [Dichotomopilus funicola]
MATLTDAKGVVALLAQLNRLAEAFTVQDGFSDETKRAQFVAAAEKLSSAARYVDENVFHTVTRLTLTSVIRCACSLNIFAVVPAAEGAAISAGAIASAVDADPVVTVRLMRALVACNFFVEVGEETYSHNALSRAFLVPETLGMFKEIYDMVGAGAYALPAFLAKTQWRNPEDYDHSAFHLGAHTNLGFWEYLEADPAKLQAFNAGQRSQATVKDFDSSYPYDTELNGKPVTGAEEVVLVDVGGGRGHALERIRRRFPGLQGRLVLQDQQSVIDDALAGGLNPAEIEPQVASFFKPNPVRGARAYLFRRVLHDWSDPVCKAILSNTVVSMGPESRVLIAEYEVPVLGASAKLALQDINMMGIGGTERTGKQWNDLLESAGLKLVKTWRTAGSDFVIIEGRKK